MSELMNKKTQLVVIAVVLAAVAAIVWLGGPSLGHWFMAMHGRH